MSADLIDWDAALGFCPCGHGMHADHRWISGVGGHVRWCTRCECRHTSGLGKAKTCAPCEGLNPRYEMYARAHGMTPDAMMDHDLKAWPGGCMAGFLLWMSARWSDWDEAHGRNPGAPHLTQDGNDFDAWLPDHLKPLEVA